MTAERATAQQTEAEAREANRQTVAFALEYPNGAIQVENGQPVITRPPKRTTRNLHTVISRDLEFVDGLRLNEHSNVVEWQGEQLKDTHITYMRLQIAVRYRLEATSQSVQEMATYQAEFQSYHPVREYLDGLKWDGKRRVDDFLVRMAGSPDDDTTRTLTRRWAISAVARIFQPGCKVDTVLVLVGSQGVGKSTMFRALGGAWFKDTAIDLRSKDAFIALRGAWLYELAELAATRPRDAETVKAFLSAPVDHYRPPYGRNEVAQERQCVFVGTTNEATFLNDPTGARRFWPIAVTKSIQPAMVEAERDQFWAEAVAAYRGRERWWLELNESDGLLETQSPYQASDPWSETVSAWLTDHSNRSRNGWTATQILSGALGMPSDKQSKHYVCRVSNVLRDLGLERRRMTVDGVRGYRWIEN
jgi:putative DNA primase/helicase